MALKLQFPISLCFEEHTIPIDYVSQASGKKYEYLNIKSSNDENY